MPYWVCAKRKRLLDYIEEFHFYYRNDTVKIAAKNHQFLGVNNAIENFGLRLQHDAAGTDKENKGKLGVFWHTQGSGKSFSMIFFTRKIFRQFTGNYTFLIVTDREDLDGQIYRNFLGAGAFSKDTKCQPSNSEDLRNMLQTNTRYIFTLIQKFRYDKGKQYPLLSNRNDIIVIVDEAHRTQYKDLAENMRTGLPNAQYIAFTGTPLLGSRELTKTGLAISFRNTTSNKVLKTKLLFRFSITSECRRCFCKMMILMMIWLKSFRRKPFSRKSRQAEESLHRK